MTLKAALRRRNAFLEALLRLHSRRGQHESRLRLYVIVNAAGAQRFGRPADEVVGKDEAEWLPPLAAQDALSADREILAGVVRPLDLPLQLRAFLAPEGPPSDLSAATWATMELALTKL